MKRFEFKCDDLNRSRISVIDANVGDIMYMRENGKIVAVKYVSASLALDEHGDLEGVCHCIKADSKSEFEETYYDSCFYRSVEDCRKGKNKIGSIILDAVLIAEDAGFTDFNLKNGLPVFEVYKWDGYYPQKVEIQMRKLDFTFDGKSWSTNLFCKGDYYRTFEECEANNHVEVILFPEE